MRNGSSVLSFSRIELAGEKAAMEFMDREGSSRNSWFDIEGFAERFLSLKIRYELIDEDDTDIIGFLSNGLQPLKVIRNRRHIRVVFERDTAVIDSRLLSEKQDGIRRFTIAHEAGHRLLEMNVLGGDPQAAFCTGPEDDIYPCGRVKKIFSLTEEMADRMAAVLLMPRPYVCKALEKLNGGTGPAVYAGGVITERDMRLTEDAADMLRVSRTAMLRRFRELRLLRYLPAGAYRE